MAKPFDVEVTGTGETGSTVWRRPSDRRADRFRHPQLTLTRRTR